MNNYETVYDAIRKSGGGRLDRITDESGLSRSTVSNTLRELSMDYMIHREKNVWYPTSATPQKVGKAAKSDEVGNDRSALSPGTQKQRGSRVVAQDADLPDVMKHIVDQLVMDRTKHNRLEGIRTFRARISKKKRRMNLLDTECNGSRSSPASFSRYSPVRSSHSSLTVSAAMAQGAGAAGIGYFGV